MERRPSHSSALRQHFNASGATTDEQPTLSQYFRSRSEALASDNGGRQRRSTEADALPQHRDPPSEGRIPGTNVFYRPSTRTMQDIPSPPPPQPSAPPPAPDRNAMRARGSLEAVPRWQPDHEVGACPVCQTAFSFFFRKHHCRKCGRVVCNSCSPHRITIPRQYVVQPPSVGDIEGSEAYPARNLGGGEIVRVCNPCVPDPWTPESAREAPAQVRQREIPIGGSNGSETARVRQRYRSHVGTHAPLPPGRLRAQSHQPISSLSAYPQRPPIPIAGRNAQDGNTMAVPSASRPRHRHTQSSANAPPPYQTYDARVRPLSAAAPTPPAHPPPYRRRREVAEEDECPVCGEELPPGDNVRQAHIEECISTRFGTPSQSSTPAHAPSDDPRAASAAPPSRPRAPTYRPRGMAVYRATEKDCVDAADDAQECVICFEEFQPGDEMGRMECLCKFHRGCIRRWWETKGAGSCPTHQLHRE